MAMAPRYQATYFPRLGCTFDAVTGGGRVHTMAAPGAAGAWTVGRCRAYALGAGFAVETWHRNDAGQTAWYWHRPAAP
jgi:hypothetical protein